MPRLFLRISVLHFILLILLTLPLHSQDDGLRFAWMSDTHIGNATAAADLSASVHDINLLGDIDFVILSGDITEYGSNEQLRLTKSILDSLDVPYHIIPGNHDTRWSESGAMEFARLWGDDRFVFEAPPFRFIGLHEGPLMRMGDGHWAPEDLRWVDSILVSLPDPKQPLIIVTHYPIDPGIDNWYELLDRLEKYNPRLVLVGHGHRNRVDSYGGIPALMGRSNLRAREAVGGYTIVDIRQDTAKFFERTPGIRTTGPWHVVALNGPHIQKLIEHPRPDFSVNKEYPNVQAEWKVKTGYTITTPPAIASGRVVVGTSAGVMHAFSLGTGNELWRYQTGGPIDSSPAVENGRIVFGSCDGRIYCLDLETGKKIWDAGTDEAVVASPAIADGVVFIGGSDNCFRALSLASGQQLWRFTDMNGHVETKPLVSDNAVFFGAWDSHFYALETSDGTLRWKWQGERPGILYSPAACWPVASDGKVFIVAPDRAMTALDVSTGKEIWRTRNYQVRESIGISQDRKSVFVRTMTDSILALSAIADVPVVEWALNAGFGYDINSAMLSEKNGVVFYGTKNGLLFAVDRQSGSLLWKHRTGVALLNTVVPLDARSVVVTDLDGVIQLIRSNTP